MILNVSGRTDIIAFYSNWFINRIKDGYVMVRNPFNEHLVSKIYFKDVDAYMFCTKSPHNFLTILKYIDKPFLLHITLTGYKKDIEPNVPDKKLIIEDIKKISNIIGKDKIYIRYDPILVNDSYTINYHIKAFNKLCTLLDGYISHIIVSFIDDYKNVRKHIKYKDLDENDYKLIGENFSKIANKHNMTVQTCFESNNLTEYGFIQGECLSHQMAYVMTGKKYPNWTARKERLCNCVKMVDIGAYNTCMHYCKYCYANYLESDIIKNNKLHDDTSPLLIGNISDEDVIKERSK